MRQVHGRVLGAQNRALGACECHPGVEMSISSFFWYLLPYTMSCDLGI